jgi:hypothetical protein
MEQSQVREAPADGNLAETGFAADGYQPVTAPAMRDAIPVLGGVQAPRAARPLRACGPIPLPRRSSQDGGEGSYYIWRLGVMSRRVRVQRSGSRLRGAARRHPQTNIGAPLGAAERPRDLQPPSDHINACLTLDPGIGNFLTGRIREDRLEGS